MQFMTFAREPNPYVVPKEFSRIFLVLFLHLQLVQRWLLKHSAWTMFAIKSWLAEWLFEHFACVIFALKDYHRKWLLKHFACIVFVLEN
jgi:hypothetical protein